MLLLDLRPKALENWPRSPVSLLYFVFYVYDHGHRFKKTDEEESIPCFLIF